MSAWTKKEVSRKRRSEGELESKSIIWEKGSEGERETVCVYVYVCVREREREIKREREGKGRLKG